MILKELIDQHAFSQETAVTVGDLHRSTGIPVQEIKFLACQIAVPGFAIIEGPTAAIPETEIRKLYIETDVDKILSFIMKLTKDSVMALGRALYYSKLVEAMRSSEHPWAIADSPAGAQLSGDGAKIV